MLTTNLNKEGLIEVLEAFLSTQRGAGEDNSDNCGNYGLRDGIIICLIKFLKEDSMNITFK